MSSRNCCDGCRFRGPHVIDVRRTEVRVALACITLDARGSHLRRGRPRRGVDRIAMAAHRVRGAAARRVVFDRLAADAYRRSIVHAEPGLQRCFEGEQTQLSVWATAEPGDVAVALAITGVEGMELDALESDPGRRQTVTATARTMGPLPDPRQGGRRRAGRAAGGHRDRRRRRRVRVSLGPTAIHCDPARPNCSTGSALTSPGTSGQASSTPTFAPTCPATSCARSTGRSARAVAACTSRSD